MKRLVKVQEVEGEGLMKLMGETVTLFCMNYFYTGKLVGVNDDCVLLEDPAIVYDTGNFKNTEWANCQKLNVKEWFVQKSAIESFGVLK